MTNRAFAADNDIVEFLRQAGHAATRAIRACADGKYDLTVHLLRGRAGQERLYQALLHERASAQAG